jgi:hypothetical protein
VIFESGSKVSRMEASDFFFQSQIASFVFTERYISSARSSPVACKKAQSINPDHTID